ncbi:MAG: hypothetical protein IKD89_01785 [Clostridia bacterium]|nr:hypothetical protein [Clostridia bacterium]
MTYKKLLIIFIIGIILVGAGAGVSVAEFGSYRNMGEKTIPSSEEDIRTESFDIVLSGSPEDRRVTLELNPYDQRLNAVVPVFTEDESLTDGLIRIETKYNGRYYYMDVEHSRILTVDGEEKPDFGYDAELGRYYYIKTVEDEYSFDDEEYFDEDGYIGGEEYFDEDEYFDKDEYNGGDDVIVSPRAEKIYPETGHYKVNEDITVYSYTAHSAFFGIPNGVSIADVLEDLKHREIYTYVRPADFSVTVFGNKSTLAEIEY